MKNCRDCDQKVSRDAFACPNCGAPHPAKDKPGWGYEYKSKATFIDFPLIHISFRYQTNGVPVPAKGIIAIGQFGMGLVNISQFGIGLFSLGQFTIAGYALAQCAFAYELIAQVGVFVNKGIGQVVWKLSDLIK